MIVTYRYKSMRLFTKQATTLIRVKVLIPNQHFYTGNNEELVQLVMQATGHKNVRIVDYAML